MLDAGAGLGDSLSGSKSIHTNKLNVKPNRDLIHNKDIFTHLFV